ncbi:FAD-dependent oxidoreductase [Niveispirillum fermenti]|uniref:FAD-dependent oxidoreductase n=1 Tax=Niveispirillum fermenti TaxID=1233113 RepID=UPI003A8452B6
MTQHEQPGLSRRRILTGAGAGMAAGSALLAGCAQADDGKTARTWDVEADIVVVGGGAAGCTAAVIAADRGARVVLLEASPMLGGTTRKSGGVAWVPNHPLLSELGLTDPKPDAMRYMCRYAFPNDYNADHPTLGLDERSYKLLEAFYDNGAPMVDKMKALGAVEFGLFTVGTDKKPSPDYADHLPENKVPVGRALAPKDENGETLAGTVGHGGRITDACETWLTSRGAPILTGHRATKLVLEEGRVIGLEARTGERTVTIGARKGVIFATGGFAHNTDLLQLHQTMLYGSCAVPQSQGDFIGMAASAGAVPGTLSTAWYTQVVLDQALENRVMGVGVFFVPSDSMVLVNKYGHRVVNEKRNYNDRTKVHYVYDPVNADYPNQLLFMLFDHRALDAYGGNYPLPENPDAASYLIKGDSLDQLAENIAARLQSLAGRTGGVTLARDFLARTRQTIDRFNRYARDGRDPDFDRGLHGYDREWQGYFSILRPGSKARTGGMPNPTMYPFQDKGPYYAIILAPGALDTSGGPLTNEKGQVLAMGNQPIPGLYGAGNCVASPTRGAYFGAGGTIGPAMTYAYIAAMHATDGGKEG